MPLRLRLRFRTKIFAALAALLGLALLAALAVVRQETEGRVRRDFDDRFGRAVIAFHELQGMRLRLVTDEIESLVEGHPQFRTILSTASVAEGDLGFGGLPSAEDALRDANLRLRSLLPSLPLVKRNEVFVVASASGELLYSRADEARAGDDLSGVALLREAAGGDSVLGVWSRPQDLPEGVRLAPEPPPRAVYQVMAQPVVYGDEVHGLVLVGNPLDRALLSSIREISGLDVVLYDAGRPVASTLASALEAELGPHLDPEAPVARSTQEWKLGGERFLVARSEIAPGADARDVGFLVLASLDAELAYLRDLERVLLAISGLILAVALGVGFALARGITQPIARLAQAAERVGRGDLGGEVSIATGDELEGLGSTFNHMVRGLRERDLIKRTFERHVSKQVAEELLRHPEAAQLAGARRELTVLFADLEGFTGWAEHSDPEVLVARLNEYFEVVCDAVLDVDGAVNDLLGDGILASFGAPVAHPDHARRACLAALAARERLRELAVRWRGKGLPEIGFRIGLHTGEVVVGEMGTAERGKYGVIGDAVNLASRLEGANKFYATQILASEATRQGAGSELAFRELDLLRVVGRRAPVRVFELLGPAQGLPSERLALCERYAEALARLRARDFAGAEALFAAALAIDERDGPSRMLLARARALRASPPPDAWEGVFDPPSK